MTRNRPSRWLLLLPLLPGGLLLPGCSDPLFPADAPRSPYARYSELRGEGRAREELDAYGRSRPALRERLAPLEAR